ncbi:hypothetical protein FACS189419_01190 [Planctomycetales bacterium]|nr:hypothetical protein FACS189419_01190 [Planctomycetales bacterium]
MVNLQRISSGVPMRTNSTSWNQPLSRLEGTLLVKDKPAAGVAVEFSKGNRRNKEIDEEFQFVVDRIQTVTDSEGKFVFEHLPVGKGLIGHQTENFRLRDAPLELLPGRTTMPRDSARWWLPFTEPQTEVFVPFLFEVPRR